MDFHKDKKTKEKYKSKRKRGLIVPLFLAYQYVIHRSVQQPAQGIQVVDRRKALTLLCQAVDNIFLKLFSSSSLYQLPAKLPPKADTSP